MTTIRQPSRTPLRLAVLCIVAAGSLVLAACGSDSDSAGGELPPGDVVITADNIAWSTASLEAPADQDFTIVIDNQDEGVQHNLDIKDTEFKTELVAGVSAQVLRINLSAGEYDYVCDLHPNMTGTLTVS